MIVLDTNVLSELMRPAPSEAVLSWLDRWPSDALFTTAITRAELAYGVALLDDGRRREGLEAAVEAMFRDFSGRVLPFDEAAAAAFGDLAAATRSEGRPLDAMDALIASIVLARGATLATRNVRDFEGRGLRLVDPWTT